MKRFAAAVAAVFLCLPGPASAQLSGRRAPGFSLVDVSLTQHDLADYRGRLVVLEFMQTGCPACQNFTKVAEGIRTRYGGKVTVLTVVNPPDNQASVQQFVKAFQVKNPILFDCGQVAASYFRATPQNPTIHLPHVFLIDASGVIQKDIAYTPQTASVFEGETLYPEIDRLLAAQGSRPAGKK